MLDGRRKMQDEGLTKAQFFHKYGFVLLDHKTSMEPHEWENDDVLQAKYDVEVEELVLLVGVADSLEMKVT